MVQFQKWRAETYVKACQQLLFCAVIDFVCKSEAHRYKWLAHGTKRYLSAWDTNPCAWRLWFITRNTLSWGRFGACAPAPMRVSLPCCRDNSSILQLWCSISRLGALLNQAPAPGKTHCFPSTTTQQPCFPCPAPGPQVGNLAAKRVFLQLL